MIHFTVGEYSPYSRSSALSRIDSSLSSRHCNIRSLWDCTDLGWVLRILDMASKPRYFTDGNKRVKYCVFWPCSLSVILMCIYSSFTKYMHAMWGINHSSYRPSQGFQLRKYVILLQKGDLQFWSESSMRMRSFCTHNYNTANMKTFL